MEKNNIVEILRKDTDPEDAVLELQRLIKCYQLASHDDQNVIWAVLNKYAPQVDGLK